MKTFKNKKINKFLSKFCILIHGGAGDISKNIDDKSYYAALESIINNIYKLFNLYVSKVYVFATLNAFERLKKG